MHVTTISHQMKPVPEMLIQILDKFKLTLVHVFGIDETPIAVIKSVGFFRFDWTQGVAVPDELVKLGKLGRYDLSAHLSHHWLYIARKHGIFK